MTEKNNDLNSQELDLLASLVEYANNKDSKTVNKVLSPKEWLASYYHSGTIGKNLYPYWKDRLCSFFENVADSFQLNCDEIVITGSIGCGKSWVAYAIWAYMLYLLSTMENPQQFLGLSESTNITFAFLSVNREQANDYGFNDFTNLLDSCEYFLKEFPRKTNKDSSLEFPKNILIVCGSDTSRFISSNMLSIIYDEANFAKSGGGREGDISKATKIYVNARTRLKSRFKNQRNNRLFLSLLVSSSTHKGSFTESIIELSKGFDSTKIISAALFDTKPKGTYSEKKFLFFVGNEIHPAKVIEYKDQLAKILKEDDFANVVPGSPELIYNSIPSSERYNFYLVPEDFYQECKLYPEQAAKDYIGISVASAGLFFTNHEKYENCVKLGTGIGLRHAFFRETIVLSSIDNMKLSDYLDVEYLKAITRNRKCYIHTDQSETGCNTGIALAFPITINERLCVAVPLMLRITPPEENDRISLDKLRLFIEYLIEELGIYIAHATYDQYQSSMSIELLNKQFDPTNTRKFAERLSVDTTKEPYVQVQGLILQERLLLYPYEPFKTELFTLIDNRIKGKVEKSIGGSKDVSDAAVACVYRCLLDSEGTLDDKKKSEAIAKVMQGIAQSGDPDLTEIIFGDKVKVLGVDVIDTKRMSTGRNPFFAEMERIRKEKENRDKNGR